MSRDVCGICWCPYDDDGKCGCNPEPTQVLDQYSLAKSKDDEALLWECFEALEACLGWPETIEKLKQRLTLHARLK